MKNLYKQEVLFPSSLSKAIEKHYGILFYNKECPLSHDTNHAVITDLKCDIDFAISDIVEFYNAREIVPRIYFAFIPKEMDVLKPSLLRHGFEISVNDCTFFFTHQNASAIKPVEGMQFRRVTEPDAGVDEIIMSGADEVQEVRESGFSGDWWKTFIHITLKVEHIHMLVGYIDGKPVTMASVNIMDGVSRIDDVKTHSDFWGRGYSSSLMDYLVKYHAAISDNVLYLYVSNPAAIKVYKKAGFVQINDMLEIWSAWKTV